MGAGGYLKQAERKTTGREPMRSEGLTKHDRCVCHPRAWGLKKGLRRGRRRLAKVLISRDLNDGMSRSNRGKRYVDKWKKRFTSASNYGDNK